MTLDLVKTAALLLSLCLLQGISARLLIEYPRVARLSSGIIFGMICIVGMMMPIVMAPGFIIDGRTAVLSMAGFFGGPVVGFVAVTLAAAYRGWLGGTGALVGIATICASMLLGLAYRAVVDKGRAGRGLKPFLVFGLLVHVVSLLLFTLLPAEHLNRIVFELALPYLLVLTITTALLGAMLQAIEDHMRLERALATSESRLRAITHANPDLVMVLDEDGRYLEVISHNEKLLVVDAKTLLGKRMHDVMPTDIADRFLQVIRTTLTQNTPQTIEYSLQTLAGERVFEGRCQAIEEPLSDRPAVLFLARDISAQNAAEQEKRIAAIAFEAQQGMVITDADSIILRVNKAFTEITGYDESDVVGKHTRMLGSGRQPAAFYKAMWDDLLKTGRWQGEVWNRRKNGEVYPQALSINAVRDEDGQVTHYVASLTDISVRKSTEAEIRTLAFYDQLTQLPNRRLLMDRLAQALGLSTQTGRFGALMFVDLDDFRDINDLLGHHNGDIVLQQAGRRLSNTASEAGEANTVARFGGDEFVVLLEELADDAEAASIAARRIAESALSALQVPYLLDGQTRKSGASVGIVIFNDHEQAIDELLRQADLAMNEAKHSGKNKLCFYDPIMQETVTNRLRLEEDIRKSIEAGEFELRYQPQYLDSGEMTGVEALVRWRHPSRGLIAPDQFIHVAERAGLMPALGLQVLDMACEQLARWARHEHTANLTIAVNVSAQQLYHDRFIDKVLETLGRSGAPADHLTLELTESMLLDDMEEAIERMRMLRSHGIRFSIDDFGTGYSSLAYLQRLPVDQLKIDRSFVQDLPHRTSSLAIVRAIIALSNALGLRVIAEGVELKAQQRTLEENGCHQFQGFLFGRPMRIDELEQTCFKAIGQQNSASALSESA